MALLQYYAIRHMCPMTLKGHIYVCLGAEATVI